MEVVSEGKAAGCCEMAGLFSSISLTYKWNSAVEESVIEGEEREKKEKGWRSWKVNPHAISSDLSITLFRASVGSNRFIKGVGLSDSYTN